MFYRNVPHRMTCADLSKPLTYHRLLQLVGQILWFTIPADLMTPLLAPAVLCNITGTKVLILEAKANNFILAWLGLTRASP